MSQIEKLVAELAPAGVEHRLLGDIAELASARVEGAELDPTTYVGVDNLLPNFGGRKDSGYGANSSGAIRFNVGDVLIGNIRPYLKKVWLADREGGASPDVLTVSIRPDWRGMILPKFLYFLIASDPFIDYTTRHAKGAKMPRGDKAATLKYRIPVPPLEVQREIVRILDHFTELEAGLEAELEARRGLRAGLANNFSIALRDESNGSHQSARVALGSIARESIEPVKIQDYQSYVSLGVKWNGEGILEREPRSGGSIKATTLYRVRRGQLIYNRMFVVEGSFAIIPDQHDGAVVSGEFPVFNLDTSKVNPDWLLQHLCDPHTLRRIEREVTGTERGSMKSRRRWKADQFAKFEISLPSLEVQGEVVRALHTTDALIESIKSELVARRQQYAYYRDKLLTFQEATA
ncbi:restriction endonuclease subunit S [Arthrobacter woluwensis]|uniref:restriction endonuclease subunit S n=1 Tax=Arthrobacter woluwensis TaxID=156980 RepID=UPI0011A99A6B|nr:restriction endonuclease subunit S [Arthrobacter woluwensis]